MTITNDIRYIGVNDHETDLFESQYIIPDGMAYNSYVIFDEKIAVMDSVEAKFGEEWLDNLKKALDGKTPDYLIVQHMEPDHSANILSFVKAYPSAKIVGNIQTFNMMGQFFETLPEFEKVTVKDGDTLSLGKHELKFIFAPMVHWPEVMLTYDSTDKVLFSADAFGKFGALDAEEDEWDCEARRYYFGIVGKYGMQVQAVLKKAQTIDIKMICPLHGPIWRENLAWFIDKYQKWSTYTPEDDGILVFYGSLYGHTESAAQKAAAMIREKSGKRVSVYDVSQTHTSVLISEVWRCGKIVLFCPTYNNGIYIPMENFLSDCAALTVQNRTFALAQNGTWAPASGKLMTEKLSSLKNVKIVEPMLTIKSALHETDEPELEAFVTAVVEA